MLHYLYTKTIDFTPPASNFLVELSKNEENPPSSRRDFLLSQATRTIAAVEPASPHCVYQLAQALGLATLIDAAKTAILNGFSVENVSFFLLCLSRAYFFLQQVLYELVSSLAYHHDEIKDAALDFALRNWVRLYSAPSFSPCQALILGSCAYRTR
jgi:hypothetical protein